MTNQQAQTQEQTIQCGAGLLATAQAENLEFFCMARGGYTQIVHQDTAYDKYHGGEDTDAVVPGQGISGSGTCPA